MGTGGGSNAVHSNGLRGEPSRVAPPSSCCASMKYSNDPSESIEEGSDALNPRLPFSLMVKAS